jgi:hypothetical protein
VVCDFTDPHNQHFLRGHNSNVTCLALSPSVCQLVLLVMRRFEPDYWLLCCLQGRLLASGQNGECADCIVWDFETKELLYRFVLRPSALLFATYAQNASHIIAHLLCSHRVRFEEHDFGISCLAFSDDEVSPQSNAS